MEDKIKIMTFDDLKNLPIKDENIITLNYKISNNKGAKKSRFNEVNTIARKMTRKLPKENFIIYIKSSNTSFIHIYFEEMDSFFGIPIHDEAQISKRKHWRKGKRTCK